MRTLLLVLFLGLSAAGAWLLTGSRARPDLDAAAAPPGPEQVAPLGRGAELALAAARAREAVAESPARAQPSTGAPGGPPAQERAPEADFGSAALGWSARALDSAGRVLGEVELDLVLVAGEAELARERVTTDSGGGFAFFDLAQALGDGAGPARLLVARRAGDGRAWVDPLPAVSQGVRDLGDLRLLEPREVWPVPVAAGRVFGTDGGPVPGVRATARGQNRATIEFWSAERPEPERAEYASAESWPAGERGQVVIEADGSFAAYGPAGGLELRMEFKAPGYRPHVEWPVPAGALDLEIELLQERRILGRILVPEDGPPVTDYGAFAVDDENSVGMRLQEDGTFDLPAVESSQRIVLRFPMLGPELGSLTLPPPPPDGPGDPVLVDFRGVVQAVRFELLDAAGRPLSNERLLIFPEGQGLPMPLRGNFYAVDSDDEGVVQLALPLIYERVRFGLLDGDFTAASEEAQLFELARLGDSLVFPR